MRRIGHQLAAREEPSEAAPSELILDAVKRRFLDAEITLTGGLVSHLARSNMPADFDEERKEDRTLLELLLAVDELCLRIPGLESHYATALAWKH